MDPITFVKQTFQLQCLI